MLASAALLFVPGLVVGFFIRLRGIWLWALAPLVSTTLLATASIVLPLLGVRWSPLAALAFAAVFGGAVIALFRWLLRAQFADPDHAKPGTGWATLTGWLVGAVFLAVHFMRSTGSPENISQTFDNVFHLNAIALIHDSGNASPFEIAKLTSPDGGQGFYPDGWHALVQLAQQFTGVSIPVAINAFNLVIAIAVWPLGVLLLSRLLAGNTRVVALSAGVLAAAFPAFPLNMLHYGVLYPYFFGLALAPAVLAVVLNLLGLTRDQRVFPILPLTVLLAGVIPAIALAHPGAMMAVLALSVIPAVIAALAGWSSISRRSKGLRLGGLLAFFAIGFVLMVKLRPGDMWGPRMSFFEAVKQALTLSLWGYGLPLVTAALVLLGVVVALVARNRTGFTTVSLWGTALLLFVATAGTSSALLRYPTEVWYGDAPRLAALVPLAAIPAAAFGVAWIYSKVARAGKFVVPFEVVGMILLLVGTQALAGYAALTADTLKSHTATDTSALLSTDEITLLERLPEHVGPEDMIAASPWTGASLAYAFADREVIFPHILMNDISEDRALIMDELKDAPDNPEVCDAAERLNLTFVLDFGKREVHGAEHKFPGIDDPGKSDAFELVDSEGDAKLYRFVGCD